MEISAFWNHVDQEIAKYDLLNHPFYQAWSAGELTRDDLKFYAGQYYRQVSEFPAYLTALHSRLPEGPMRRDVLANAYEEECEIPAHSDLWLRFLQGLGGGDSDGSLPEPIPEISNLVMTFRAMSEESPIASAFGALFAYESQVPRIASEKLAGLKKHYGADERTCGYFTLHRTADIRHSNVWRKIITNLVENDDRAAADALDGVGRAARALWTALDGIERARPDRKANACAAN
jgi:pyrroloquinoline-quinone synthase